MTASLHNPNQSLFAIIDCKLYTAWTMVDGKTMVGTYISTSFIHDSCIVLRPDGSTCRVPDCNMRPATRDDIKDACDFYASSR